MAPGGGGGGGGGGRMPQAGPPVVEVALASRASVRKTVSYVATFEATESVTILPKLSGRIEAIPVRLGDFVKAGEVLAVIEDDEFAQQVRQAEANLNLALAQLKRSEVGLAAAQREFDRADGAKSQGLTTQQELDSAIAALETAKADIELSKAEIARAQAAYDESALNLTNTQVLSPLDGYVDKRRVDRGALVSPSTDICTIVRLDPAKVVLNLPEGDLASVRVGTTAQVRLSGVDSVFDAHVERIAPTVELNTRTALVELSVPNPDGLFRPGMSAELTVVARDVENALVVPESALVRGGATLGVQRVIGEKVALTPIEVGIVDNGRVEVLSGLEEGDRVVVRGQFMIADGDTVKPTQVDNPIQAD